MKKTIKLNHLDQAIFTLSNEFSNIPDYSEKMKDEDLKNLHVFVAIGIAGITESKNLVISSFIPATNKAIVSTRALIKKSVYVNFLQNSDDVLDELKNDIIRLGYVFTFHKFESFIKQLINKLDIYLGCPAVSSDQYCEQIFGFSPLQWYNVRLYI